MKKETRELLLDSGFKEFYQNGYQGASVAAILNEVGINKGSMYHFFKSKKALALAVIKERIHTNLALKYTKVLEGQKSFERLFQTLAAALEALPYGCPLNKMSQEMAYIDNDFHQALSQVYTCFEDLVEQILTQAVEAKIISSSDTILTARHIIATYEGALMMYHLNRNTQAFVDVIEDLKAQLELK